MVKNPPAMQETWIWSLGWEDPLEQSTPVLLPGKSYEQKSHGRLQSTGWQKARHDLATKQQQWEYLAQLQVHFVLVSGAVTVLINSGSQLSGFQTPQGSRGASAVQDRRLISVGCQEETLLAMGNQHIGLIFCCLFCVRDIENTPSSVSQRCVFFVDSSINMQWAEAFDCYPNGWHSDILPSYCRKRRGTKKPLDESERGEWKILA